MELNLDFFESLIEAFTEVHDKFNKVVADKGLKDKVKIISEKLYEKVSKHINNDYKDDNILIIVSDSIAKRIILSGEEYSAEDALNAYKKEMSLSDRMDEFFSSIDEEIDVELDDIYDILSDDEDLILDTDGESDDDSKIDEFIKNLKIPDFIGGESDDDSKIDEFIKNIKIPDFINSDSDENSKDNKINEFIKNLEIPDLD